MVAEPNPELDAAQLRAGLESEYLESTRNPRSTPVTELNPAEVGTSDWEKVLKLAIVVAALAGIAVGAAPPRCGGPAAPTRSARLRRAHGANHHLGVAAHARGRHRGRPGCRRALATGRDEVYLGLTARGDGCRGLRRLRVEPAWPISAGTPCRSFGPLRQARFPDWARRAVDRGRSARRGARGIEGRGRPGQGAPDTHRDGPLVALRRASVGRRLRLVAGTLTQSSGFFALLDRFGLMPFLVFLVAPVAFRPITSARSCWQR